MTNRLINFNMAALIDIFASAHLGIIAHLKLVSNDKIMNCLQ